MKVEFVPGRGFRWVPAPVPALAQQGFTLVEVLVAIVVLSFGVLGVVGMQAAALQSNHAARNQSTAIALGRELADMLRTNKTVSLQPTAPANRYLVDFTGTLPAAGANCFTGACASPTLVAEFDLRQWLVRVNAALPGARVVVCFDDTPYVAATGRPQWVCDSAAQKTLAIKIGWTQKALDSGAAAPERTEGVGDGTGDGVPGVVLPVIPGSST